VQVLGEIENILTENKNSYLFFVSWFCAGYSKKIENGRAKKQG
jgi:hypothetical protein